MLTELKIRAIFKWIKLFRNSVSLLHSRILEVPELQPVSGHIGF